MKDYSISKSKEMPHSTISEYRNAVLKLVFNQGVKYSKTQCFHAAACVQTPVYRKLLGAGLAPASF